MRNCRSSVAGFALASALAVWLAVPVPAAAQPASEQVLVTGLLDEGRYLDGLVGLERIGAGAASPGGALDIARAFIFGGAAGYVPANVDRCPAPDVAGEIAQGRPADAMAEIVRRARAARIVILNENHFDPRHRAFGLRLARALRPLGYRHLAMEALTNQAADDLSAASMAALARRGHAVHSTGIYTNEPMFADFIRQALALGYRPYAYDGSGPRDAADRVAARDEYQAQTIYRRALAANPGAKLLIYVGFGHVAEGPFQDAAGRRMELMGARLKRISGLDPLTIDQREQIGPDCLPAAVVRRGLRANRFGDVVLSGNGASVVTGRYRGAVDLQVFHLPVAPIHRRPAWMTQIGRRPLPIPARLLVNSRRRLVQAFMRGSAVDAVPIDQLLVQPGDRDPPPLMVPSGNVVLRVQDERVETPAPHP